MLKADEKTELYKTMIGKGSKSSRFESKQRAKPPSYRNTPVIVNRLTNVYGNMPLVTQAQVHAISFTPDKECIFLGISMFVEPNKFLPVSLTVYNDKQDIVSQSELEELSSNGLSTSHCQSTRIQVSSVPLYLSNPLYVEANETYTVEAKVPFTTNALHHGHTGPTCNGIGGQPTVKVTEATVSFTVPSFIQGNVTTVADGQLPQLFFKFHG